MGQFIEFLDEKGRFVDVQYCLDAQGSLVTSYCMSTKQLEEKMGVDCYRQLRVVSLAQDMAEQHGLVLTIQGYIDDMIDDMFDDGQLTLGFDVP
jgi:hypothetical protein